MKPRARKSHRRPRAHPLLGERAGVRASVHRSRIISKRDRTALARILARYEGARWNPTRSYIPAAVQSPRFDAGASTRLELIRKSRYFEKNNPILNRMADLFESYTIGAGLQINPASSDPAWNARAKIAWDGWCALCDLTSRQTFATLFSLGSRTWFIDGECFIVLTHGPSSRPRITLIESHLVGTPPQLAELEGDSIIDGIQIDPNGRPVAYWIASEDKHATKTWKSYKAEFVVHLFEPSRPGQYRGLPFCYPVINDLHDLDDLQLLEMKAARDASDVTNVLKNTSGEFDDETLLREADTVTGQDLTGASVEEARAKYLHDTVGGRSLALRVGEDYAQFEIKRPAENTFKLWRHLTEKICAGVGISYILVFPESMQGTVYRGALDMANAWFRARYLVPAAAATRIYEYVMDYERITTPLLRDPPATWKQVAIHPPRAVNVDVGRNSAAALNELKAGGRTFAGWYGELGLDWRNELRQRATEAAYVRDLAAEFQVPPAQISEFLPGSAAPAPAPDPDDEKEDEEDTEKEKAPAQ